VFELGQAQLVQQRREVHAEPAAAVRRDRRPAHVQRRHHRNRHQLLSPRPSPSPTR